MFKLSTQPANTHLVKLWKRNSGLSAVTQGAVSIGTLLGTASQALPPDLLDLDYAYMALAVSFTTALLLFLTGKVITLSLAQMGFATGLLLFACSFHKVFASDFMIVIISILAVIVLVVAVIFLESIQEAYNRKSWSDLLLRLVLYIGQQAIHIYAIYNVWRLG
jgi:uncharacterized membrane protein